MSKISFQLVTPEKTVLSQELDSLSCPTQMGQITILPNHIPLVANMVPGELVAKDGEKEFYIGVTGGFVEVRKNSQVVVLADTADHYYEISEQKEQEAVAQAKDAMKEKQVFSEEYAQVAASLEKNLARLKVVRKRSHSKNTPITSEGNLKE